MSYLWLAFFSENDKLNTLAQNKIDTLVHLICKCFWAIHTPHVNARDFGRNNFLNIWFTIGPNLPSDRGTWESFIRSIELEYVENPHSLLKNCIIVGYIDWEDYISIDEPFSVDQIIQKQRSIDFVYFSDKSTTPKEGVFDPIRKDLCMYDRIDTEYSTVFLGIKSYPQPSITCPCCWFVTLFKANHVYEICDVCEWEDDPVQFDFPDTRSWANKESLREKQSNLLLEQSYGTKMYHGYFKDQNWKSLPHADSPKDGWIWSGIDYFKMM